MNILVTGGKGVVGTGLVKYLESQGHEVWVCDLKHSHEERYIRCDVGKYRQLLEVFEQRNYDLVYHLAAEFGRWNGEDYYEDLWVTNCIGTKNMLRLQEKLGFKMVFASSSEVYGDYDGLMKEEVMDKTEIRQLNDYAISKWVNELQIMNAEQMYGSQTVRVRLFNTYGPGEYYSPYRSAISIFAYRALHDQPYTVYLGHQRTSLYIDDCTACLANLAENFKPGEVYNIAGREVHDMKTASDMVLEYLGKNDRQVRYVNEERFTTRTKLPDNTKAVQDLGLTLKVGLREGIARTVDWMKEVYRPEL